MLSYHLVGRWREGLCGGLNENGLHSKNLVSNWWLLGEGQGNEEGWSPGGSMPVMVGFGVSNDLYHFS